MARKIWTPDEVETLMRLYADTPTSELAVLFGRPKHAIYHKAQQLGLKKSADYLAAHCRLQPGTKIGKDGRFRKGHLPANKGTKRPGFAPGRMRETQFKKGSKPSKWAPIGSKRLVDGYLHLKVTDTGYPPRDWKPIHRLIWEEANGPIPAGHVVIFKDGDKSNIVLANLEIISRGDLAAKNSMWNNYPRELSETIQLAGVLKRKIKRRNEREKQD